MGEYQKVATGRPSTIENFPGASSVQESGGVDIRPSEKIYFSNCHEVKQVDSLENIFEPRDFTQEIALSSADEKLSPAESLAREAIDKITYCSEKVARKTENMETTLIPLKEAAETSSALHLKEVNDYQKSKEAPENLVIIMNKLWRGEEPTSAELNNSEAREKMDALIALGKQDYYDREALEKAKKHYTDNLSLWKRAEIAAKSYSLEISQINPLKEQSERAKIIAESCLCAAEADDKVIYCSEKVAQKTKEMKAALDLLEEKVKRSSYTYVENMNKYTASGEAPKNLTLILNKLSACQKLGLEGIIDSETRQKIDELLLLRKEFHDDFHALSKEIEALRHNLSLWESAEEAAQSYYEKTISLPLAEEKSSFSSNSKKATKLGAQLDAPGIDSLRQVSSQAKIIAECRFSAAESSDAGKAQLAKQWSESAEAFINADELKMMAQEATGFQQMLLTRAQSSLEQLAFKKLNEVQLASKGEGIEKMNMPKSSSWFSFFGRKAVQVPSNRPSSSSLLRENQREQKKSEGTSDSKFNTSSTTGYFYDNIASSFKKFTQLGLFRHFVFRGVSR